MDRIIQRYCRLLDGIAAVFLAIMVVLVFANVVLRYVFNSGISASDEVSRWLFVWVTFLGATAALHDHTHLGTDVLVSRLPRAGKKACLFIGHVLMLYTAWLLFQGSLQQARINWDVTAPTTGASVAIFYASGVVFAVGAAVILLLDIVKLVTGRLRDDELVMVQESEETATPVARSTPDAAPFAAHVKA
ncbi:MAG: TRAP transporter small permease [Rhodocyclaceae bacterium]